MNVNNNQKQQSTICLCGGKYRNNNRLRHLKTKIHQDYLMIEDFIKEIEIELQKKEEKEKEEENNHWMNIFFEQN
jgi:pSer/pThr/pTyr-binding forkhead associated (FHA) protein